jgi:hypothetical protein
MEEAEVARRRKLRVGEEGPEEANKVEKTARMPIRRGEGEWVKRGEVG